MSKKRKGTGKHSAYGAYNLYGYAVYEVLDNGYVNTLYTAGNSRYDSQGYDVPGAPGALDIDTMRQFCEQTTREIAEEQGATYTGVEHDTDSEKENMFPR